MSIKRKSLHIKKKKTEKCHDYYSYNSVLGFLPNDCVCVRASAYASIYNVCCLCISCMNIFLPHIPWLHSMGDAVSQGEIVIRSVRRDWLLHSSSYVEVFECVCVCLCACDRWQWYTHTHSSADRWTQINSVMPQENNIVVVVVVVVVVAAAGGGIFAAVGGHQNNLAKEQKNTGCGKPSPLPPPPPPPPQCFSHPVIKCSET